uniref:Putative secreted protein ovary overexpressed n=1 Tax=Rhipicephalus microplus TaxID=6941 RepID=A0A6M2DC14_RHIMP
MIILCTLLTFWLFHPSKSSVSVSSSKSASDTTPRVVFMDRCGVMVIGTSPNVERLFSFTNCALSRISRRRSPLAILVTLYPAPRVSVRHLATTKGDTVLACFPVFSQ